MSQSAAAALLLRWQASAGSHRRPELTALLLPPGKERRGRQHREEREGQEGGGRGSERGERRGEERSGAERSERRSEGRRGEGADLRVEMETHRLGVSAGPGVSAFFVEPDKQWKGSGMSRK